MRKLIVNADDFGFSKNTFEWTVQGFEEGKLSSATLMANMPYTEAAVAYAKQHPQFGFGVHLYFSDEVPVSRPKDIPSMIDPATGNLWQTRQFILRSLTGRIRISDLKREISAQITVLKDLGLDISHVDGHGHMHRLPTSLFALSLLKKEFGIRVIRRAQNVYGAPASAASRLFNSLMQIPLQARFRCPDLFLMTAGKITEADSHWFSQALQHSWNGIYEIGVHPGDDEAWRILDCKDMFETTYPDDIELVTFREVQ